MMPNSAKLPLLLEPAILEQHLNDPDLLIIDLCNTDRYRHGHIPGAIHVPPAYTQLGKPPAPGLLPTLDMLEHLFSQLALTPERHVVVYDDEGGGWAGRFIWILDSIGHTRYSVVDGGMIAWEAEGHPLSADIPELTPTAVSLTLHPEVTATLQDVMNTLNQNDTCIWDARSAMEYHGQKVFAAKGGHIPGAANFEWTMAMDPANHYRMKSPEALLKTLTGLGMTTDKQIVTHCHTHHRSGYTYLVAKALGFAKVKAYAGSWSEWGNHPETPVEI